MKIKSDTRSVARAFAEGESQPSIANSVFHNGRVIYSYGEHWPLAVKLDNKRVLLNNDRYSITTSHHRSAVAGALARAGWEILGSTLAECKAADRDPTAHQYLYGHPEDRMAIATSKLNGPAFLAAAMDLPSLQ